MESCVSEMRSTDYIFDGKGYKANIACNDVTPLILLSAIAMYQSYSSHPSQHYATPPPTNRPQSTYQQGGYGGYQQRQSYHASTPQPPPSAPKVLSPPSLISLTALNPFLPRQTLSGITSPLLTRIDQAPLASQSYNQHW